MVTVYRELYFSSGAPHLEDLVAKAETFTQALTCAFIANDPAFQLPEYQFTIHYSPQMGAAVTVEAYSNPANMDRLELFHILYRHDNTHGWQSIYADAMLSAYHDLRKALCVKLPDNATQLVRSAEYAYMSTLEELPDIISVFPHEGVDNNGT